MLSKLYVQNRLMDQTICRLIDKLLVDDLVPVGFDFDVGDILESFFSETDKY